MCDTFGRIFFALWPSKKKTAYTEEGLWLRKMCMIACVCHFGLSLTGLAIIGFMTMLINFLQTCWAYSCYLTLREREIWTYCVILFFQVLLQTLDLLGVGDDPAHPESSMQTLGHLICLCVCCLLGYAVGKSSYDFRKAGGLHGNLPAGGSPVLLEDKIAGYAKDGAEFAEGAVNDYLDKEDKKDSDYKAVP